MEHHDEAAAEERALILVVERDPHVKMLERFFLEQAGFRVELVGDGEQGLARCREIKPHILIAEILLPRRDGLSICRALKADPETRGIPVLLFSILSAADRASDAGADAFLQKPLDDGALIATVEELLARRAARRSPA